MKKNRSQTRDVILSTISILCLILIWFLVSGSRPDFFPTPMATIERFIRLVEKPIMGVSILGHIFGTLSNTSSSKRAEPEMKKMINRQSALSAVCLSVRQAGAGVPAGGGHRPFPKAPALCGWLRGGL